MTMTEMAVRFWDKQSGEERIEEVSSEQGAAKFLANLLAHDVRAEVVTREHFEPPPWTVNRATQNRLDRQYVETTVAELANEEISLRAACDWLRLIATGLIHPADVRTTTEGGRKVVRLGDTGRLVHEECLLSTWLERAANIRNECEGIQDGSVEKADTNDETLDAEYENHLNVLANLVDHSGAEYGCTRCTVTTRPTTDTPSLVQWARKAAAEYAAANATEGA